MSRTRKRKASTPKEADADRQQTQSKNETKTRRLTSSPATPLRRSTRLSSGRRNDSPKFHGPPKPKKIRQEKQKYDIVNGDRPTQPVSRPDLGPSGNCDARWTKLGTGTSPLRFLFSTPSNLVGFRMIPIKPGEPEIAEAASATSYSEVRTAENLQTEGIELELTSSKSIVEISMKTPEKSPSEAQSFGEDSRLMSSSRTSEFAEQHCSTCRCCESLSLPNLNPGKADPEEEDGHLTNENNNAIDDASTKEDALGPSNEAEWNKLNGSSDLQDEKSTKESPEKSDSTQVSNAGQDTSPFNSDSTDSVDDDIRFSISNIVHSLNSSNGESNHVQFNSSKQSISDLQMPDLNPTSRNEDLVKLTVLDRASKDDDADFMNKMECEENGTASEASDDNRMDVQTVQDKDEGNSYNGISNPEHSQWLSQELFKSNENSEEKADNCDNFESDEYPEKSGSTETESSNDKELKDPTDSFIEDDVKSVLKNIVDNVNNTNDEIVLAPLDSSINNTSGLNIPAVLNPTVFNEDLEELPLLNRASEEDDLVFLNKLQCRENGAASKASDDMDITTVQEKNDENPPNGSSSPESSQWLSPVILFSSYENSFQSSEEKKTDNFDSEEYQEKSGSADTSCANETKDPTSEPTDSLFNDDIDVVKSVLNYIVDYVV